MSTKEELVGLEAYCKILYDIESLDEIQRNSITVASDNAGEVVLTKISSQPMLMTVLFCETFLESVMGDYSIKELFTTSKKAEFDGFTRTILTGEFKKKQDRDGNEKYGISKDTNIKFHKLLQLISNNTDNAIIKQSELYSSVLKYTYAIWEKEGKNKINISNKYSAVELRGYNKKETIAKKYKEIRSFYNIDDILPDEWPDYFQLISACLFIILTNYKFPTYLDKKNDLKRSEDVKQYKTNIVQNIRAFFEKPYTEYDDTRKPEDLLGEWSEAITSAIKWCDECVEIIPELTTVKNIRFNLDARQTEINRKYARAITIMDQSENEMNEVLDIIRTEINKMPGMMAKLEMLRKAAEKVNPAMLPIYDESMNETFEKTFTIGALKNESRRDD